MTTPTATLDSIDAVLTHLGVEHWDYLLIGDGSGTLWGRELGWAASLIVRATGQREQFYGSMNTGTNITAELMAYVHAAAWLSYHGKKLAGQRLHIVTDCQPLLLGAGREKLQRVPWAAINSLKGLGLSITWHWVERDRINFNRWAHRQANASRLSLIPLRPAPAAVSTAPSETASGESAANSEPEISYTDSE